MIFSSRSPIRVSVHFLRIDSSVFSASLICCSSLACLPLYLSSTMSFAAMVVFSEAAILSLTSHNSFTTLSGFRLRSHISDRDFPVQTSSFAINLSYSVSMLSRADDRSCAVKTESISSGITSSHSSSSWITFSSSQTSSSSLFKIIKRRSDWYE